MGSLGQPIMAVKNLLQVTFIRATGISNKTPHLLLSLHEKQPTIVIK